MRKAHRVHGKAHRSSYITQTLQTEELRSPSIAEKAHRIEIQHITDSKGRLSDGTKPASKDMRLRKEFRIKRNKKNKKEIRRRIKKKKDIEAGLDRKRDRTKRGLGRKKHSKKRKRKAAHEKMDID